MAAGGHRYLLFVPPHQRPDAPLADAPAAGPGPQFAPPQSRPPRAKGLPLMPLRRRAGQPGLRGLARLVRGAADPQPARGLRSGGRRPVRAAPGAGDGAATRRTVRPRPRFRSYVALRLKSLMDSQRRLLHDASHELRSLRWRGCRRRSDWFASNPNGSKTLSAHRARVGTNGYAGQRITHPVAP